MKRFWDSAAAAVDTDGWRVLLDGKPVRLPDGPPLRVGRRALAEAIAAEWQAAGGTKDGDMTYADVPLTRIAGTAQLRIAPDPEPIALELARYAGTDLLCYRATHPDALVQRQHAAWQPWLDWANQRHGARLHVTSGVMHVTQPDASLAALAQAVAAYDPLVLAGLGLAVPALGSLVLGLAMAAGALDGGAAHDLATLDEMFQEQLWGRDAEAAARRAKVAAELNVAGRFMTLAQTVDA
jgi:chaperone required for assembly of F1-ATPase